MHSVSAVVCLAVSVVSDVAALAAVAPTLNGVVIYPVDFSTLVELAYEMAIAQRVGMERNSIASLVAV